MNRPVFSVTSHGKRMPFLWKVLAPLSRVAKYEGFDVVLSLHESDVDAIPGRVSELIDDKSVELLVSSMDFGSNMKYILAAGKYADRPIIVHDDDIVFLDETYSHIARLSESSDTVLARRVRKMRWDSPGVPSRFPNGYDIIDVRGVRGPTVVSDAFPEGCNMIAFPPGFFGGFPVTEEELICTFFHDDDIALRIAAIRSGVRTTVIDDPNDNICAIDFYSKPNAGSEYGEIVFGTAIWGHDGPGGRRTTDCLRKVGRELWEGRSL